MVNKNRLRGAIASKGYDQKGMAEKIGISARAFSRKINVGAFGSDEIDKMIDILDIKDPKELDAIFFDGKVTSKVI